MLIVYNECIFTMGSRASTKKISKNFAFFLVPFLHFVFLIPFHSFFFEGPRAGDECCVNSNGNSNKYNVNKAQTPLTRLRLFQMFQVIVDVNIDSFNEFAIKTFLSARLTVVWNQWWIERERAKKRGVKNSTQPRVFFIIRTHNSFLCHYIYRHAHFT